MFTKNKMKFNETENEGTVPDCTSIETDRMKCLYIAKVNLKMCIYVTPFYSNDYPKQISRMEHV